MSLEMNGRPFASTLWSQVLSAADPSSHDHRTALESLMSTYWPPLYAFARRRGHDAPEAADMVQEFFVRLMERQWLADADPQRGRFRGFLKTAFRRFLSDEWDRSRALKRGGGTPPASLDLNGAEGLLLVQPEDSTTPEQTFDRQWALVTLNLALGRLLQECTDSGRTAHYHLLKASLGEGLSASEAVAREAGLSPRQARNTLFRLRRRLRNLIIEQLATQVDDPRDLAAELAVLRLSFE